MFLKLMLAQGVISVIYVCYVHMNAAAQIDGAMAAEPEGMRAVVFDHLYDGVIVTSIEGIIMDWNVGAERMFGWSREDVLGKNAAILLPPSQGVALTNSINSEAIC